MDDKQKKDYKQFLIEMGDAESVAWSRQIDIDRAAKEQVEKANRETEKAKEETEKAKEEIQKIEKELKVAEQKIEEAISKMLRSQMEIGQISDILGVGEQRVVEVKNRLKI
jgi:uncharacterized protein (DUF3084 family)